MAMLNRGNWIRQTRRNPARVKRGTTMLDIWFGGLGLGLIGLMAAYLALLRKA